MESPSRRRVVLLAGAVALGATAIAFRLYELQWAHSDEIRAQARRQHEQQIEIEGRRGDIVDRFGRELAVSTESFSLFAHPYKVQDPRGAARLLARVLDVPEGKIAEKLQSDSPFVWIARRVDPTVASAIRALPLPVGNGSAFGFETEGKRFYPQGSLAVHVVGFANIDQKGVEGIEHAFDSALQGDSSAYLAARDGRGGTLLQLVRPPARQPDDVVLALDLVLQQIVERELDRAVEGTRARSATAVLLDPTTGEVLALANRPAPDPSRYGKGPADERRNRALTDLYEPGSTFKVVSGAAALDRAVVSPSDLFDCERGTYRIAGRLIHDHHPNAVISFRQVIERSSNIGMIKAGRRLTDETLYDYIRRFGFGKRCGIELPGEQGGLVAQASRWTLSTHASVSFGHEIGVTALQMASAVAAIANDGVRVPPRIVLGIRDASGSIHPAPAGEPVRVVSSETARTMTDILEGVILRGTGREARVPGYRIAGKTGTAQKVLPGGGYSQNQFIASFVGFGPIRSARVSLLVALDSPTGSIHTGGLAAGPVFARIMSEALTYLRVTPDEDPRAAWREEIAKKPPRRQKPPRRREPDEEDEQPIATLPGQVPDLRGLSLRDAIAQLTARSYKAAATGSGVVAGQSPPPGTPLDEGATCALQLTPEPRVAR